MRASIGGMDAPGCHECGATWTRLGPNGCCAWRGGCETRIQRAAAKDAAFQADYDFHFVPLDCGHTRAEHLTQWQEMHANPRFGLPPAVQQFLDQYGDDEPG